MRATGYLREIPDAPPHLALEAQERAFVDACADAGLDAGRTFVDVAANAEQPELTRMLRALSSGQRGFDIVFVADLKVLGDGARERALRVLQLAALQVPLRLADGRDPPAALLHAWSARGPTERRRERAVESMRRLALRGQVLGRAPYGYRIEDRRLVPDPAEAQIVRRIFAMYLEEHEGVRRIAARLNAEGATTRSGAPWNQVSVRALLRNAVYTGTYRRLGVTIPRAHPPLVAAGDFDAVQRRMSSRRSAGGPQHREEYALAGVAHCGYCGARMIGSRRAGSAGALRYYQCSSATNQGRCARHSWRAEELEAEVLRQVASGSERQPVLEAAPAPAPDSDARQRALLREIERMLERWASGQRTWEQLTRYAGPLALQALALETEVQAPGATEATDTSDLDAMRERLLEAWEQAAPGTRRALLQAVVREVLVTDEGVRVALA